MTRIPASRWRFTGAVLIALGCCAFHCAYAEPFIGQFELKTLESSRGSFEFQSQNAWSWGQPSRSVGADGSGEFAFDENAVIRERYALELEMGFTRFVKMRLGVEFEKERLDDPSSLAEASQFGDLELSELGAELIAILSPREGDGAGYGVVAELEAPTDWDDAKSLILGPIVEFQSGQWFAAAVPMAVYAFGGEADEGEDADAKWDFAYAAQLVYTFSQTWALALEGYGTVERIGNTGRPSDEARMFGDFNQHRAGAVLYYTRFFGAAPDAERIAVDGLAAIGEENERTNLTVGLGLLEGLNGNTPDHTLKLSIEVQF